ncbi:succinyldiaminopimelate desuccinylase [Quadrisphaera granulorum]|uniref:Succinyl-diaminopimelate desuccinylase n=1 Tax=Quadrisphaera granulorum TaxID=317664 RepID=A0A316AG01_9ACTN|nr:succinyl-diaminopimelate desuccinylase [Quadrisphaera granulorum]PWJ56178.1 succinyldiaminopimelate desuccinylase [Quadrisphaera granulorum]SZE94812.1 succinyldiaminopimelate desuccinylase [Quadrisphaera granulorum]
MSSTTGRTHDPAPHHRLDLTGDVVDLAAALCDVESVSGREGPLADLVEDALRHLGSREGAGGGHYEVLRHGDAVVARTRLGRAERVVVAGHLDTVPLAGGDVPSRREVVDGVDRLVARGATDMKGGVAMALSAAAAVAEALASEPRRVVRDVTWVFYDHEEVDSSLNGLGRLARRRPEWLAGDVAVLGEPTNASIEGGCNGTLRAEIRLTGRAAHSARSWVGVNAIHLAAPVLSRLAAYEARSIEVDGLVYREGLNAVGISGGVAGNVIPDACTVTVNHRFAPCFTPAQAEQHVREVFAGLDEQVGAEIVVVDAAPGARPGLDHPATRDFVQQVQARSGRQPVAKLGWTDVARFSELGVPAVNFGPGDPLLAHTAGEWCSVEEIRECREGLLAWLLPTTTSASSSSRG